MSGALMASPRLTCSQSPAAASLCEPALPVTSGARRPRRLPSSDRRQKHSPKLPCIATHGRRVWSVVTALKQEWQLLYVEIYASC